MCMNFYHAYTYNLYTLDGRTVLTTLGLGLVELEMVKFWQ